MRGLSCLSAGFRAGEPQTLSTVVNQRSRVKDKQCSPCDANAQDSLPQRIEPPKFNLTDL